MNRLIRLLPGIALLTSSAAIAEHTDLLRLSDGQLEGRFGGLTRDGVVRWARDDGNDPLRFQIAEVEQIILRDAEFIPVAASTSFIELIGGDRIPGRVVSLSADELTFESDFAGPLTIARDMLTGISPNPFGGRLIYAGPFDARPWQIRSAQDAEADLEAEEAEEAPEATPEQDEEGPTSWKYRGGYWYHDRGADALTLDAPLPSSSVIRFRIDWRGTPSTEIAFYADFAASPQDEGDAAARQGRNAYTQYFGNAFVMKLRSNYVNLYHVGFEEDGSSFAKVIRGKRGGVTLRNKDSAEFELRTDLDEGFAALYVDGEFWIQWPLPNDARSLAALGTGLGFRVADRDAPVRLGQMIVAEWNGMTASARTLENRERDVITLTNGTDRFSGEIREIQEDKLILKGQYAPLEIPLTDIAEIHFARDLRRPAATEAGDQIRVHFQPIGVVSGQPIEAGLDRIRLRSPLLDELEVSLDSAKILEFRAGGSFLDAWNDSF